ncbi:WYL domain-containing protein [Vibrio lamellibrachiae]|uniref:WYL domain-containing protein n=1 Tax=Vibrio lamellibrachiae TaxID=2910253 RepID=UPI003D0CBB21
MELFGLIAILALYILYKIQQKKFRERLVDPKHWRELVRKNNLSKDKQEALCKKYKLDHFKKSGAISSWAAKLTSVWAGEENELTFDYTDSSGDKSQRKVSVSEILINDENMFYVRGFCYERQEDRHFNVGNMENVTFYDAPYSFPDWCQSVLSVNLFGILPNRAKSNISATLWEGECAATTFTYRYDGRDRLTVYPIRLELNGTYKNLIARKENGVTKTFFVQNIDTMLATEGHKKKHFDDWVESVLLGGA